MKTLKILTHFAHGVYQTELSQVPNVEFYHIIDPNGDIFAAHEKPKMVWGKDSLQPTNVFGIEAKDVNPADYDLMAIHWHPLLAPFKNKWPSLKTVFCEHTWPMNNLQSEINHWHVQREKYLDFTVFITPSSREAWGEKNNPKTSSIYHSIDLLKLPRKTDYTSKNITTTTNEFISRNWACGFTLWCNVLGLPHAPYFKDIYLYGYGNDNLSHSVVKGPLPNDQIWRKLQNETGVYFNPSIMSPIPMSLLEAVAIGVPIVSTAYCEPGKIFINGVHGVISNDLTELRSGIKMILSNPDKGKEFATNALQVVKEKFDPFRFQREWRAVFDKVIQKQ